MTQPRPNTGNLPPDALVTDWRELCLFLGGDTTSFTGRLLELVAKADQFNLARLLIAFPREVTAWQLWREAEQPWRADALDSTCVAVARRVWRGGLRG